MDIFPTRSASDSYPKLWSQVEDRRNGVAEKMSLPRLREHRKVLFNSRNEDARALWLELSTLQEYVEHNILTRDGFDARYGALSEEVLIKKSNLNDIEFDCATRNLEALRAGAEAMLPQVVQSPVDLQLNRLSNREERKEVSVKMDLSQAREHRKLLLHSTYDGARDIWAALEILQGFAENNLLPHMDFGARHSALLEKIQLERSSLNDAEIDCAIANLEAIRVGVEAILPPTIKSPVDALSCDRQTARKQPNLNFRDSRGYTKEDALRELAAGKQLLRDGAVVTMPNGCSYRVETTNYGARSTKFAYKGFANCVRRLFTRGYDEQALEIDKILNGATPNGVFCELEKRRNEFKDKRWFEVINFEKTRSEFVEKIVRLRITPQSAISMINRLEFENYYKKEKVAIRVRYLNTESRGDTYFKYASKGACGGMIGAMQDFHEMCVGGASRSLRDPNRERFLQLRDTLGQICTHYAMDPGRYDVEKLAVYMGAKILHRVIELYVARATKEEIEHQAEELDSNLERRWAGAGDIWDRAVERLGHPPHNLVEGVSAAASDGDIDSVRALAKRMMRADRSGQLENEYHDLRDFAFGGDSAVDTLAPEPRRRIANLSVHSIWGDRRVSDQLWAEREPLLNDVRNWHARQIGDALEALQLESSSATMTLERFREMAATLQGEITDVCLDLRREHFERAMSNLDLLCQETQRMLLERHSRMSLDRSSSDDDDVASQSSEGDDGPALAQVSEVVSRKPATLEELWTHRKPLINSSKEVAQRFGRMLDTLQTELQPSAMDWNSFSERLSTVMDEVEQQKQELGDQYYLLAMDNLQVLYEKGRNVLSVKGHV